LGTEAIWDPRMEGFRGLQGAAILLLTGRRVASCKVHPQATSCSTASPPRENFLLSQAIHPPYNLSRPLSSKALPPLVTILHLLQATVGELAS
jgi:hypothetical protein